MDNEEVVLKCKGGGNMVSKAPLFSPDGTYMYIPWTNVLRCFSTVTGERVVDFEECNGNIISAQIHPHNSKMLLTCSEKGEIIFWEWRTQLPFLKKSIKIDFDEICTFQVTSLRKSKNTNECQALISWREKGIYRIGIFTLGDGELTTRLPVKLASKDYALDTSGSHEYQYLAVILGKKLKCIEIHNKVGSVNHVNTDDRKFTCVACHPDEVCVATGDEMGRILIWRDVFIYNSRPAQAIYHWHTLPVRTIAFSKSGYELFSGADECVVVKWRLDNINRRNFLPRLPAPIAQLAVAPENLALAISTDDNAVLIVDSQFRTKCVVQQIVRSASVYPAGLHADVKNRCLVMNGRVGQLQFYSPLLEAVACNLDAVGQNCVTRERDFEATNTEIVLLAIWSGNTAEVQYFATVEERADAISVFESRLKVWRRRATEFILDASVEWPHCNSGVKSLDFRHGTQPSCATTGVSDHQFKIWGLDAQDRWSCLAVASYRLLDAGALAYSVDGSLLAVAFDATITVWTPDTLELRCSLTHPQVRRSTDGAIDVLTFGRADKSHILVCAGSGGVYAWNLLTLGLIWSVNAKVKCVSTDVMSHYLAACTVDGDVIVFTPCSPQPVYTKRGIGGLFACAFMPRDVEVVSSPPWLRKSVLYLIDDQKQLLCIDVKANVGGVAAAAVPGHHGRFRPLKTATAEERFVDEVGHLTRGLVGSMRMNELVKPPVHTMAPMRVLCAPVLRSMVLVDTHGVGKELIVVSEGEDDGTEENNVESDEEVVRKRQFTPPKHCSREENIDFMQLRKLIDAPVAWASDLIV